MNIIIKNFIVVLKRFGVSSWLAVVGLAIAYAVFYLVVVQSFFDFRFDRNLEKADSIFLYSRIIPNLMDGAWRVSTNTVEPKECAEKYSEIVNFCYLTQNEARFNIIDETVDHVQYLFENVTFASIGFIDMFKPKILYGDVNRAFMPEHAMLTERTAKKLFGNKNPIGEIIDFKHSWYGNQTLSVAAVCADFPDNCSLKNGIYAFQQERERSQWGYNAYFEIDPSNSVRLLEKINKEQVITKMNGRENETWQYELTALPKVHLRFPAKGEGNLSTVIMLLTVGTLLLVVSFINFVNFSVAMAPVRTRNINLRKILGESPFMLKLSLILETAFLSFFSFLLSGLLIYFINMLNIIALKDYFLTDLSIKANLGLFLFIGLFSIITGFFAGIYPAFYTTSFNPAMAISGAFSQSSYNNRLKNVLTSLQFITAVFLITTTLFIKFQYEYMLNKDWGIKTENVLYFNAEAISENVEDFITEIKYNSHIVDVTASDQHPGKENIQSWGRVFEDLEIEIDVWSITPNFFDFFNINLMTGEKFNEYDTDKMILNHAFLNKYGFVMNEVLKKQISGLEITGVVEDFNYKSVHSSVQPLVLKIFPDTQYKKYYYKWVFVKTYGANTKQTADFIRDTWKKFSNEPVEVLSLTESIQSLYQKEQNMASIVSICGIIAIIVAIIGLYGLVLFDSRAKRKSIAIRKIHGAKVIEVMLMLNQNLLIRFAVSCVVALPLSYYAVNRWLEQFAYKTPVYWWVFALGGLIVLIISLLTVSWECYKAANANPVDMIKME